MVKQMCKKGLVMGIAALLVGGVLFGDELFSYLNSSIKSVQTAARDTVPIEFELKRAQDLLDDVIPEMHAKIRLIAQEEVEVANLKSDIERSEKAVADQRTQISKLRKSLDLQKASYSIGRYEYTREEVKDELGRRFENFKEAELVLQTKKKLLASREHALRNAIEQLDTIRSQKVLLENKIETLASQHRLLRTAAADSKNLDLDNSKLTQTEELIASIKKRLEVAERVLAHESKFIETIPVGTVREKDLLDEIDSYFEPTAVEPEKQQSNEASDSFQMTATRNM